MLMHRNIELSPPQSTQFQDQLKDLNIKVQFYFKDIKAMAMMQTDYYPNQEQICVTDPNSFDGANSSEVFPLQLRVIDLIMQHEWQAVIYHLTSQNFIDEISSHVYKYPMTLLHIACTVPSVPVDVIRNLINLYPHACLAEDEDGRLPIHLASTTAGISVQIIRTLMIASPKSCFKRDCMDEDIPVYLFLKYNGLNDIDLQVELLISSIPKTCVYNEDTSLIHDFCDKLLPSTIISHVLNMYPQVCQIQNVNSDTLLHLLCSHRFSSLQTIIDVVNMYPEACETTNSDGNLPLHLVNVENENEEVIKLLLEVHPCSIVASNASGQTPLSTPNFIESPIKVKAVLAFSNQAYIRSLLHTRNHSDLLLVEELFYKIQCDLSFMCHRKGISTSFLQRQYSLKVVNQIESLTYLMRTYVYGSANNMIVGSKLDGFHSAFFWTAFPLFTKLLLQQFPHHAKEQDCNGNFPLHVITKDSSMPNNCHQCSICSSTPIAGPYFWYSSKGTYMCSKCSEKSSHDYLNDSLSSEFPKQMPLVEYTSKSKMKIPWNECITGILLVCSSVLNN